MTRNLLIVIGIFCAVITAAVIMVLKLHQHSVLPKHIIYYGSPSGEATIIPVKTVTYHVRISSSEEEIYINKQFQISIKSDKKVYKESERINLTVTLKNVSECNYIYLIPDVADDIERFWEIESDNGKIERIKPYAQGTIKESDYTMLYSGNTVNYVIDIKTIWKFIPGFYKIKASYQGQNWYQNPDGSISEMDGVWWGRINSNTITVEIKK